MRKKAIKKKLGSRNEMYKMLRESENNEVINLKTGSVRINPLKHLLMNEKYNNDEMNKYLADIVKQYSAFIEQRKKEMLEEAVAKATEPTFEVVKEEEQKESQKRLIAKKVICEETGIVYDSMMEAFQATGVNFKNISAACRRKNGVSGNFHWSYFK